MSDWLFSSALLKVKMVFSPSPLRVMWDLSRMVLESVYVPAGMYTVPPSGQALMALCIAADASPGKSTTLYTFWGAEVVVVIAAVVAVVVVDVEVTTVVVVIGAVEVDCVVSLPSVLVVVCKDVWADVALDSVVESAFVAVAVVIVTVVVEETLLAVEPEVSSGLSPFGAQAQSRHNQTTSAMINARLHILSTPNSPDNIGYNYE